jgi:glutaminyl-tRNA synthetase
VKEQGATQISNPEDVLPIAQKVLSDNQEVVAKYKSGQTSVKGFLVGQVMKQSGGRANPAVVQQMVGDLLEQ